MVNSSEHDELFEEYMELKAVRYTENNKRGFNVLDGYFYTGVVTADGCAQVIYRDESGCLEVYHIDATQKELAATYWNTYGLPMEIP